MYQSHGSVMGIFKSLYWPPLMLGAPHQKREVSWSDRSQVTVVHPMLSNSSVYMLHGPIRMRHLEDVGRLVLDILANFTGYLVSLVLPWSMEFDGNLQISLWSSFPPVKLRRISQNSLQPKWLAISGFWWRLARNPSTKKVIRSLAKTHLIVLPL